MTTSGLRSFSRKRDSAFDEGERGGVDDQEAETLRGVRGLGDVEMQKLRAVNEYS